MTRLVITGYPGSGKSTHARILAKELGIPHIEADLVYWQNGKAIEHELFRTKIRELILADQWVYEGHISKVSDLLKERVTAIKDIPTPSARCLIRVLKRGIYFIVLGTDRQMHARRLVFNIRHWRRILRNHRDSANYLRNQLLKT